MDVACSRFRADSELSRVNAAAGGPPTVIGELFALALQVALRAARITDGAVDPTVGQALIELGYDRDIGAVRARTADEAAGATGGSDPRIAVHASGAGNVMLDLTRPSVALPAGVALDLGATAKALAADRAARQIAATCGCGVLVGLGGDIAMAGPPPAGGWPVRVTDDHAATSGAPGQNVTVVGGGLATSSITTRTWQHRARQVHHILDPATGLPASGRWRTVSVTAATCVDANIAATAAIVRGSQTLDWLAADRLPARLVDREGCVTCVNGWPADTPTSEPAYQ